MANDFLSLLGWLFLPNLVTGWLQTALYTIFIRAGEPKPVAGTLRFNLDRRRIHIFVILAYLLYTVVEADYQIRQAGDFYRSLEVPLNVDDKGLQSRFRRITVQFHPDKVSGPDRKALEAVYVYLKVARDTLAEDAKRFAYDRFGPDILTWQHCKTVGDFVTTGVMNIATYYVGTAAGLMAISILGYLPAGKFWRFLVMGSLFVFELHVLTRPTFPGILTNVINPLMVATRLRQPLLPFQMLALLRKLALTFFIALSQLQPLLKRPNAALENSELAISQQLGRLDTVTMTADQELSRLLGLEVAQYGVDSASKAALRASLKDWLVQNLVRNDQSVKNSVNQVFEKRRQEDLTTAPPSG